MYQLKQRTLGRAIAFLLVLLVVSEHRRSFVQTAPTPQGSSGSGEPPKDFDEVKQLEDLKNSLGKTFSLLKAHASMFTDINGQQEEHSQTREEVSQDGKLLARMQQKVDSSPPEEGVTQATRVLTELDIPSRGIHKTIVQGNLEQPPEQQPQQQPPHESLSESIQEQLQEPMQEPMQEPLQPPMRRDEHRDRPDLSASGERNSNEVSSSVTKYLPYSGVQYTPLDMAEYVFWTGDERGVTMAIEEFLQEGLMSREEAINFLQEIKLDLDYLQNHYTQQHLHKDEEKMQAKERAALLQKALGLDKPRPQSEEKFTSESSHDCLLSKKSATEIPSVTKDVMTTSKLQQQNLGLSDEDYEELLERLRVADFLYTEYSLEEVIYQLAKVMFTQSLNRGNTDAQEALQKFTNFLESEAEQGHISRSLEKKVLDVLIASLADTLSEHPHLVSTASDGLGFSGGNKLLHQLLLLNPAAMAGEGASAGGTSNNSDFASGNESHQSTLAKARQAEDENGSSPKSNKAT